MKISKKGSSLVLVLIVFSVLSILGTAMISLAASNYKIKILRGNIKTNMYASESGIDEVYGIIGKMVDGAIIKGNGEVKTFMDNLDLTGKMKKKETLKSKMLEKYALDQEIASLEDDDAEKSTLIQNSEQLDNYINNPDNDSIYISPTNLVEDYKKNLDLTQIDLVVNLEYIKEKQNEIFKENYKNYIIGKLNLIDESNANKKDDLLEAFNTRYIFKMPDDQKSVVYINNFYDSNMSFGSANDILTINLESAYTKNNIEKIIKADYDIDTPDYGNAFYVENNSVEIDKNIVWSKAISADGNLKVEDGGTVDIDGNIYIRGDSSSSDSGVSINNSKFNITGHISTLNDLKLVSSNNTTHVNGNIYAKNVILTETANNSKLISNGSVYTSDDLELNSTEKGNIDIKGAFYGLEVGNNDSDPDHSSSIIINSDDLGTESSLTIGGKGSIIMGTSYINTTPYKYQTGESLSIKGNYRAYMEPLTDIDETERSRPSLKSDNIHFEDSMYEPLIPADRFLSDNSKLLVFDKSDYIKYYMMQKNKNGEADGLITKGVNINLSEIYHTGAIMSNNGEWNTSNTSGDLDITEILKQKKYKYKKNLYFMGEESVTNKDIDDFADFNAPLVANQLKSDGISSNASVENEKFVIKNNDYALIFPKGDTGKIPASISDENRKSMGSEYNGIVIVNGDLYVCGEAKFKGTIICTGSVHLVDDNNKNIVYDEDIVKNIVATNYDVFKDIFQKSDNKTKVVINSEIGSDSNSSSNIYSNKLIKLKNWSLVK